MHRKAIWAIGCGQLVIWGVMYFAFGVLLVPLEQSLGTSRAIIAGAFSLGLLVSAGTAPAIGRLADQGQGPAVIQIGGLIASLLLVIWAMLPSLASTYIVWALLGVCMSAILYEPVFAIVGRAISDPAGRMRAIATVTVMGGLASSAFLPGTAALVSAFGWRVAAATLGIIVALSTLIVGRIAFRDLDFSAETIRHAILDGSKPGSTTTLPEINRMMLVFGISSIVNSAIASNLVAALIDGGFAPAIAASVAGLFGIMQLPGRLLMTSPIFAPSPVGLVVFSFALQVIGLIALMLHSATALVMGVIVFAAGAGLTTLARPSWVLQRYRAEQAGFANGLIARAQQIARAFGPVSAAALAEHTSYAIVFAMLNVLLVSATLIAGRRPQQLNR